MAHPDDAEILCGGTLIRLARLGWQVHIATTARGDCGSATLGPDEIAAIRFKEGQKAAQSMGATYHCLGLPDVNVSFCEQSNRQAIDLFRAIAPTLVFTHPRFDYMLDHEQTHLLARSATFSYPIPNASPLPLIDGSQVPWLYYVDPLEGLDPYSGRLIEPTTLIDVSAVIDDKAAMLACHASQRDWLRRHHGMDEYIESMKRHGATRGRSLGVACAEAFVQHRGHAYPEHDVLKELLP
ncbi:MAG: PIG-L family deacetylase [Phycisphaeraceae bacterium]|nr:PIG-L family deacetylase [Phycisphaeraceae bacterium]